MKMTRLVLVALSLMCSALLVVSQDAHFWTAIGRNALEVVRKAVEQNPSLLNVQNNENGQTPLMAAVLAGSKQVVEYLLAQGADTSIGEKDGYSPIHGAGFQGRAEIAKMLLAHGVDPLSKHQDGFIGLHRACWGSEQRHTDTVTAFLEHGVDVNTLADNGDKCDVMTRNKATKKVLKAYGGVSKKVKAKKVKKSKDATASSTPTDESSTDTSTSSSSSSSSSEEVNVNGEAA